ncbi:MAG: efflux RND transporter periplasmic adaptor subunit [Deltaproteobacteria bacterium]|nr:efflux RND transporter periplasmic adaptor subunit [Candidatus Zymogenaceae bacterium]
MNFRIGRKEATIAAGIIIVLFLSLVAFRVVQRYGNNHRDTATDTSAPITVSDVYLGTVEETLFYTADLHAENEAEVYSLASGKVIKYNYKEGEPIRKGATLVTLERQEKWDEYMPVVVEAPISGIVAREYLDVGELATVATPLALIVGGDTIKAVVKVPDVEIGLIKAGMKARLTIAAMPGAVFDGEVHGVSPFLDPNTRTARVELSFKKTDPSFASGMFGDITIITKQKDNVTCIPVNALLYEKGGRKDPYCYVIRDNSAHKRSLTLGIVSEDTAEVIAGLKAGVKVAVSGRDTLKEGAVVRIVAKP